MGWSENVGNKKNHDFFEISSYIFVSIFFAIYFSIYKKYMFILVYIICAWSISSRLPMDGRAKNLPDPTSLLKLVAFHKNRHVPIDEIAMFPSLMVKSVKSPCFSHVGWWSSTFLCLIQPSNIGEFPGRGLPYGSFFSGGLRAWYLKVWLRFYCQDLQYSLKT